MPQPKSRKIAILGYRSVGESRRRERGRGDRANSLGEDREGGRRLGCGAEAEVSAAFRVRFSKIHHPGRFTPPAVDLHHIGSDISSRHQVSRGLAGAQSARGPPIMWPGRDCLIAPAVPIGSTSASRSMTLNPKGPSDRPAV